MKSTVIDIDVVWMHETERAVLVAADEESEPVWMPKSLVDVDGGGVRGAVATITLPQRLAEEKGLV